MLQLSVFPSFLHEWPTVQISVKSPVYPILLTRYSCATVEDQSTKPTISIYFSVTQLAVYKPSFFNFPTEQALAISFSAAKINPLGSRLLLYCLPICLSVSAEMWPSASPRTLSGSDSWPQPSELLPRVPGAQPSHWRGKQQCISFIYSTFSSKSITALVDQLWSMLRCQFRCKPFKKLHFGA